LVEESGRESIQSELVSETEDELPAVTAAENRTRKRAQFLAVENSSDSDAILQDFTRINRLQRPMIVIPKLIVPNARPKRTRR
jgi:fibronectin type 3 domain-containing protein